MSARRASNRLGCPNDTAAVAVITMSDITFSQCGQQLRRSQWGFLNMPALARLAAMATLQCADTRPHH